MAIVLDTDGSFFGDTSRSAGGVMVSVGDVFCVSPILSLSSLDRFSIHDGTLDFLFTT